MMDRDAWELATSRADVVVGVYPDCLCPYEIGSCVMKGIPMITAAADGGTPLSATIAWIRCASQLEAQTLGQAYGDGADEGT